MFMIISNAEGLMREGTVGHMCIAPPRMSYFVMTELHLVIVTHVYG